MEPNNQVSQPVFSSSTPVNPAPKKGKKLARVIGVVILLSAVGAGVYYWQQQNIQELTKENQNLSSQLNQKETVDTNTEEVQEIDKNLTFSNEELGYSFTYPEGWVVVANQDGGKLQNVEVNSEDLALEDIPVGGQNVEKGTQMLFYPLEKFSGDVPDQFTGLMAQMKANGTLVPKTITLGSHKAVQFSLTYEGPKMLHTYLVVTPGMYAPTNLQTEGEESKSKNLEIYDEILKSIKKL